jgi:Mrp family chromosome partitioning ATPase
VRVIVVGGSASNVGKTTLAVHLAARARREGDVVAMKVSVRERPCETRVLVLGTGKGQHRKDSDRFADAGASAIVWVTVNRANVRRGLASGLREARRRRPRTLVIESTSAGIEMRSAIESYFVAGDGEWKPWAYLHRNRAHHVLTCADVARETGIAFD